MSSGRWTTAPRTEREHRTGAGVRSSRFGNGHRNGQSRRRPHPPPSGTCGGDAMHRRSGTSPPSPIRRLNALPGTGFGDRSLRRAGKASPKECRWRGAWWYNVPALRWLVGPPRATVIHTLYDRHRRCGRSGRGWRGGSGDPCPFRNSPWRSTPGASGGRGRPRRSPRPCGRGVPGPISTPASRRCVPKSLAATVDDSISIPGSPRTCRPPSRGRADPRSKRHAFPRWLRISATGSPC